jgi:Glutathione peroxidase
VNYGVTFTMTEPQKVRGNDATHLFKIIAKQSAAPKWNFYKYVVDRKGKVFASFSSLTKPDRSRVHRGGGESPGLATLIGAR